MTQHNRPTIYVIDDEAEICRSTSLLLSAEELPAKCFSSAEQFLAEIDELARGIILSDVRMGGMTGIELIERLRQARRTDPVIIITAHADVELAVQALKAGAVDLVEKPFSSEAILKAIDEALEAMRDPTGEVHEKVAQLSHREREVLDLIVYGKTNKEVAIALDISPRTVEIYRAKLMNKMRADTLPALVRMTIEAGIAAH
ncbi:response regulator transcription factor [Stakelama marina]|uniref:Response regulator n=1 Tax=Stakelama marina TaxID=2826939 RepID=A0A8T4IA43_9SPHN|nr:response regulator [Stakelama marina]MBR0551002.1 response regulator [Stakelama marina]